MENLYFYPTLSDDLMEASGCVANKFEFSYLCDGEYKELNVKGKNPVKLEEPSDSWRISEDGLHLKREIIFEYPDALYGKYGIARIGAEIGVCIIWTNKTLTQMGTLLPDSIYMNGKILHIIFEHDFAPGEIEGDLELETNLYIKEVSDLSDESEIHLVNEKGVNVGQIDTYKLDFGSIYMDFPIREVCSPNEPLWWLDTSTWVDPREDLFDEDNVCLYLNSAYDCCPKLGDTIKNQYVLIDIISTAYTMIFERIKEMGALTDTINDVDLKPGSICKVMFYFLGGCDHAIDFNLPEKMNKSIWMNVLEMISGDETE